MKLWWRSQWLRSPFVVLALALPVAHIPIEAAAACSDSKVKRLSRQGKTVTAIATTCDMDVDDVRDVLEEDEAPQPGPFKSRGFASGTPLGPCGCWGPVAPTYRQANSHENGYAISMCPQESARRWGYAWQAFATERNHGRPPVLLATEGLPFRAALLALGHVMWMPLTTEARIACLLQKQATRRLRVEPCGATPKASDADVNVLEVMRTSDSYGRHRFPACPGGRFYSMPVGTSESYLVRYHTMRPLSSLADSPQLAHVVQMRNAGGPAALNPQRDCFASAWCRFPRGPRLQQLTEPPEQLDFEDESSASGLVQSRN